MVGELRCAEQPGVHAPAGPLVQSLQKTGEAFVQAVALKAATVAIEALVPVAAGLVHPAFALFELVQSVRASSIDDPELIVPLPDFVRGIGLDVHLPLGADADSGQALAFPPTANTRVRK